MLQTGTLLNDVVDALCHPTGSDTKDKDAVFALARNYAGALMERVPQEGIHMLIDYGFCIHCDEVPRAGYFLWSCMGASDRDDETSGRLELHDPSPAEVERS